MLLRILLAILAAWSLASFAQTDSATLQINLRDPQGAALAGCVEVANASKDVRRTGCVAAGETFVARSLPPGRYGVVATSHGFESAPTTVNIANGERKQITLSLSIAKLNTQVQVQPPSTLLDPTGATVRRLSTNSIERLPAAAPGRTVIQAVRTEPGWVLESNGVLHPRGSEYDTLFVVDGFPVAENRSPVFAPETPVSQVDAIEVSTGDYSAEYGRHLGGVVEVTTAIPHDNGSHGQVQLEGGSFATTSGSASFGYGGKRTSVFGTVNGFGTDRYLDPPTEDNFRNGGTGRMLSARLDHDFGSKQTIHLWFTNSAAGFHVPNEIVQQVAGQRQDRDTGETAGYLSYDRALSNAALFSAKFMAREGDATLTSNAASTPISPQQDRTFGEQYLSLNLAAQRGGHAIKTGGQFSRTELHEQFSFAIADPAFFDPDVPPRFAFNGSGSGHTEAFFVQDRYHRGPWTFSAGARWDRYTLLLHDSAVSPRLALAYYAAPLGLVLHASYDRAFEEPPVENLLLASSASLLALGNNVQHLPVPLSRGDFGEAGMSKLFSSHLRLDANAFLRNSRNFLDDDLLLNTGVSLPTSFARASIYGAEVKLDMPHWSRFSGSASYSYLLGRSITPLTGGLFLEADAKALLQPGQIFPITQDQRNTAFASVRYQVSSTIWTGTSFLYGSGLPTEIDPGITAEELASQFSSRILEQVDFARDRVKPNYSLAWSLGWTMWQHDRRNARLQLDVTNLTNKLNVINFAGLFSGTGLARPRAAALRVAFAF